MISCLRVATRESARGAEEGASPSSGRESGRRSARERALVDGRRPGVAQAAVFDETAVDAVPGGRCASGRSKGCLGRLRSRQGTSEAEAHARLPAENAAVGRCRAEEHSIEAPPVPRGAASSVANGVTRARRHGGFATKPKLEVRRQAKLHLGAHRRLFGWRRAGVGARLEVREDREATQRARSGIGQFAGCSDRGSVAEVGERHLFRCRSRARRDGATRSGASADDSG